MPSATVPDDDGTPVVVVRTIIVAPRVKSAVQG